MATRNPVRQQLESGDIVLGAEAKTATPMVVEVLGNLGVDFVWVDLEHTGPPPYDSTALENLTRAAEVADVELLVRIPSGANPAHIRKVISAGVTNVLVTRIRTAAEARRVVRAGRIVYGDEPGTRGISSGAVNNWGYPDLEREAFIEREDSSINIGVMIEQAEAVEDLDEILSVPDLGFVYVGPGDLSVSLGHPMNWGHPDVQGAIERIRNACLDAGVPVGRSVLDNEASTALELVEKGYQVLRFGSELVAVRAVLSDQIPSVRDGLDG